ncbi:MAG: HAMP domain-containing histidine kinase [Candidatus Obscuribacterales bacterium]|nr:HAMP domain-containing histidine kinase [Candidatus Obscuribacterales bacterium]
MSKNIFPVISDETAARSWRKDLLRASTIAASSGSGAMVLLAVTVCPDIVNDARAISVLFGGAALVAIFSASFYWYSSLKVVEAARSRMQSARRFLQDAGHELATPVAILGSRIQVMAREPELDDESRDHLNVLSESTCRLSVLVDDMRALARAEAPRSASDLSIINLGDLVHSISAQMKDVCAERGITIVTDVKPVATIIGEREGVERAITNLLSNAVRYGRNGGKVRITIRPSHDSVELTVQDDGIGVSPEELPKIFDRFYRAERSRKSETPGSGLGLAIVKAVVESHSGKVYAESEFGSFTRFTVEFPKSPVHPIMKMMKSNT